MRRLLPWLVLAAAVPLAFLAGTQLVPRTEKVDRPVLVRPAQNWDAARLASVFKNLQPYRANTSAGIACRSYASSAQPPVWAVDVCAAVPTGPAG